MLTIEDRAVQESGDEPAKKEHEIDAIGVDFGVKVTRKGG